MNALKKWPDKPKHVPSILDFTGLGDKGLVHGELLKFSKYPAAEGLYCQKTNKPFQDRLLERLDREHECRESAKLVTTFDEKIAPEPLPEKSLLFTLDHPHAIGLEEDRETPPGTEMFPEIKDLPQRHRKSIRWMGSAFDWMAGYISSKVNENGTRVRLLEALRDHPKWVEIFIRKNLPNLCKNAARATGEIVKVDFVTTPVDIVEHLKLFFSDEIEALRWYKS